jgi:hypothetical protein
MHALPRSGFASSGWAVSESGWNHEATLRPGAGEGFFVVEMKE